MRAACLFLLLAFTGCKMNNSLSETGQKTTARFTPVFTPGPRVLVYKTKADYRQLVPVLLSPDKQQIVSYPHPTDVQAEEGFLLPARLQNNYLLDKKGIGENVAFLSLSYAEYAKLPGPPSREELKALIQDSDPLLELCDCGNKSAFTDTETQLNQLISSNQLRIVCRVIK